MTTKAAYALFSDPDSAQRGVDCFRAAGIPDRDITVISSEPFEEHELSHKDKATWMYWIAAFGGLIGLSAAYGLTTVTQQSWPLNTGGMPIVAMWPNLIILFEMTMLGGILATVITLLVTAKLPRRRPRLYDPEVSEGKILVGAEDIPESSVEPLQRALYETGAGSLKTLG